MSASHVFKVYGKPGCVQCNATKRFLHHKKQIVLYYDVEEEPELKDFVISQSNSSGQIGLPLVIVLNSKEDQTEIDRWFGFRASKIDQYSET